MGLIFSFLYPYDECDKIATQEIRAWERQADNNGDLARAMPWNEMMAQKKT